MHGPSLNPDPFLVRATWEIHELFLAFDAPLTSRVVIEVRGKAVAEVTRTQDAPGAAIRFYEP